MVLAKLKGYDLEMKLQKSGPQGDLDIFKSSALITTNGCKVNRGKPFPSVWRYDRF